MMPRLLATQEHLPSMPINTRIVLSALGLKVAGVKLSLYPTLFIYFRVEGTFSLWFNR